MKLRYSEFVKVFARIVGRNGKIGEYIAIVDPNSKYCVMRALDAIWLGYSEAANRPRDWKALFEDRVPFVEEFRGIERAIRFPLESVSVGGLTASNVDAVVLEMDMSRNVPFDVVLGASFLKHFKLGVNVGKGELTLGPTQ